MTGTPSPILVAALLWLSLCACSDSGDAPRAPESSSAPAPASDRLRPAEDLGTRHEGLEVCYRDASGEVWGVVATPHFHLEGEESVHPAVAPVFSATTRGRIRVARPGVVRFHYPGEVRIGGRRVGEEGIDLASGEHELELEVERRDLGATTVRLEWEGPRFSREPVPARLLSHRDPKPERRSWQRWELGRRLASEHSCARCHEGIPAQLAPHQGPSLSQAGARLDPAWIERWLAATPDDPDWPAWRAMPAIPMNEAQRADLGAYLGALGEPPAAAAKADATLGAQLYVERGCAACHEGEDAVRPLPTDLASKTSAAALAAMIADPAAVHPDGRMPDLFLGEQGPAEAAAIAAHLLERGTAPPQATSTPNTPTDGDPVAGERWVQELGCLACHELKPSAADRLRVREARDGPGLVLSGWRMAGPFDHGGRFEEPRPFEAQADPARPVEGPEGRVDWQPVPALDAGRSIDLFGHREQSYALLEQELDSAQDTTLVLELGSDDRVQVFLDGTKIHESLRNDHGRPKTVRRPLPAGPHRLRLRVGNDAGRWQLMARLRHEPDGLEVPLVQGGGGPDRAQLDLGGGCLESTGGGAHPVYSLDPEPRLALREYLASGRSRTPSPAPIHDLAIRVQALGCTACHEMDGVRPEGLNERPPPLSVVGDKLRASWFDAVMLDGKRVRPWLSLRMPHYPPDAVRDLPRAFAHAAGRTRSEGREDGEAPRALRELGVRLLGKGEVGLACISCHDFKEYKALGPRGPDLVEMDARIRPEWMERWLWQPSRTIPGTSMPSFFAEQSEEEGPRQRAAVMAALAMREHLPPLEGLVPGEDARDRLPPHRPLVQRTFLPDMGPAAIAVALPGFLNYAWDSDPCRPRYAWEGDFLDMRPAWRVKGETLPTLLGARCLEFPDDFGVHPPEGTERDARYLGHRREAAAPRFHYTIAGVPVHERAEVAPEGLGLRFEFRLPRCPPGWTLRASPTEGQRVRCSLPEVGPGVWALPEGDEVHATLSLLREEPAGDPDHPAPTPEEGR